MRVCSRLSVTRVQHSIQPYQTSCFLVSRKKIHECLWFPTCATWHIWPDVRALPLALVTAATWHLWRDCLIGTCLPHRLNIPGVQSRVCLPATLICPGARRVFGAWSETQQARKESKGKNSTFQEEEPGCIKSLWSGMIKRLQSSVKTTTLPKGFLSKGQHGTGERAPWNETTYHQIGL